MLKNFDLLSFSFLVCICLICISTVSLFHLPIVKDHDTMYSFLFIILWRLVLLWLINLLNLLYLFIQVLIVACWKIKGSFAELKNLFDSFRRNILNFSELKVSLISWYWHEILPTQRWEPNFGINFDETFLFSSYEYFYKSTQKWIMGKIFFGNKTNFFKTLKETL